jgi:hypothetical protein
MTDRCSSMDQVYFCTALCPNYEIILISVITLRNFLAFSRFGLGQFLNFCPVCLQIWIVQSRFRVVRQLMAFQVDTCRHFRLFRVLTLRKYIVGSRRFKATQYSHLQVTKCEKSTQGPNNKFFGVFAFEDHNATLLRDTGIRLYTDASTYSAGTERSAIALRKFQFSQRKLLHSIHI